jgi:hypothetical protein
VAVCGVGTATFFLRARLRRDWRFEDGRLQSPKGQEKEPGGR